MSTFFKKASESYDAIREHVTEELTYADEEQKGDEYLVNVINAANALLSQSQQSQLIKLAADIKSALEFYKLAYGDPNYAKGLVANYQKK